MLDIKIVLGPLLLFIAVSQSLASASSLEQCIAHDDPPGASGLGHAIMRTERIPFLGSYFAATRRMQSVKICYDNTIAGCRGYFEPETGTIGLHPGLNPSLQTLIIIHELRHVAQAARGFGPTLDFAMSENARQTFALEADAEAIKARAAYLARLVDPDLWQAAISLEHYGDLPRAFANAMANGTDLNQATLAAFETWYSSDWRIENYFRNSCSNYLDQLASSKRLESFARLPPDHFDDLCSVPGDENYLCHQSDIINFDGWPQE